MKKTNYLFISIVASIVLALFACKADPKQQVVTGYVIDATMNNVMLVTDTNDTLNISTMDADTAKVKGVLLNDSVKVTYVIEQMGDNKVNKAVELVVTKHSPYFYIAGTWIEPNPINAAEVQGVTLNADGTASSVNMATLLFKSWKLEDNHLILSSTSIGNKQTIESIDTLLLKKLDADSLVLTQPSGTDWSLARQKN